MTPRHLVVLFVALYAVYGAVDGFISRHGAPPSRAVDLVFTILITVTGYLWYYRDSLERHYRRTALLGGAVILLPPLAVPYYLLRSRPRGQRLKAIGGFAGVVVLAIMAGMLASALVGGLG